MIWETENVGYVIIETWARKVRHGMTEQAVMRNANECKVDVRGSELRLEACVHGWKEGNIAE
jgi:hypothetical protein